MESRYHSGHNGVGLWHGSKRGNWLLTGPPGHARYFQAWRSIVPLLEHPAMRIVGVGVARGLLAIASASLAIWCLRYGQFASQSLPAWIPGREAWVYGSALVV